MHERDGAVGGRHLPQVDLPLAVEADHPHAEPLQLLDGGGEPADHRAGQVLDGARPRTS